MKPWLLKVAHSLTYTTHSYVMLHSQGQIRLWDLNFKQNELANQLTLR